MPERSEIAGGTPGALVIECGEAQPYSEEDWAKVARVLPSGAPADARYWLEREIAEFRDMPSAKDLREVFHGYAEEAAQIENAVQTLIAAIDASSVRMLVGLRRQLPAALEEVQIKRAEFKRNAPGAKEKSFDPWTIYTNRLCSLWCEWTGEAPRFSRTNGIHGPRMPKGPLVDFLMAAASPARQLRAPWNKKALSVDMAATAICTFRDKSKR